jgi:hypothetical protein
VEGKERIRQLYVMTIVGKYQATVGGQSYFHPLRVMKSILGHASP